MNDKQKISDDGDLRKYRIELPNLYDDSDLTPYEFRLLAHYKRVGLCFEGTQTTARKCRMSVGKVSQCRQTLSTKGFIKLEKVDKGNGQYYFNVTVKDKWAENFKRYSPSPHEHPPSLSERTPSPHEVKKEPIKKEPVKNPAAASALVELTQLYEANIGAATPIILEELCKSLNSYGREITAYGITEAAKAGAHRWAYAEKVMERVHREGYATKAPRKSTLESIPDL